MTRSFWLQQDSNGWGAKSSCANDYRSIHTTVIGPGQQRVELQIRTREMHQVAEYGIAAHALYKDGLGSPTEMLSRESSAYGWLRHTIELLAVKPAEEPSS